MDGQDVIFEEELDENYEPTTEEIEEYAKWLGMDLKEDADLMWVAREALKTPLPPHWKACKTAENGELYYFNFETLESTWDHPCDEYYKSLYGEEKKKKLAAKKASAAPQKSSTPKIGGSTAKKAGLPSPHAITPLASNIPSLGALKQQAPLAPIMATPRGESHSHAVLAPIHTPAAIPEVEQRVTSMVKEEVEKQEKLRAARQQLEAEIDDKRKTLEKLNRDADAEKRQIDIERATLSKVEAEIDEKRRTLEKLNRDAAEAESRVSNIAKEEAEKQERLRVARQQLETEIDDKRKALEKLNRDAENERRQVDTERATLSKVETEIDEKRRTLEKLNRDAAAAESRVAIISKEEVEKQEQLRQTRKQLEAEIEEKRRTLIEVEGGQTDTARASLSKIEAEIESSKATLRTIEMQISTKKQIAEMMGTPTQPVSAPQTSDVDLSGKISEATAELQALERNISTAKQELEQIRSDTQRAESRLRSLDEEQKRKQQILDAQLKTLQQAINVAEQRRKREEENANEAIQRAEAAKQKAEAANQNAEAANRNAEAANQRAEVANQRELTVRSRITELERRLADTQTMTDVQTTNTQRLLAEQKAQLQALQESLQQQAATVQENELKVNLRVTQLEIQEGALKTRERMIEARETAVKSSEKTVFQYTPQPAPQSTASAVLQEAVSQPITPIEHAKPTKTTRVTASHEAVLDSSSDEDITTTDPSQTPQVLERKLRREKQKLRRAKQQLAQRKQEVQKRQTELLEARSQWKNDVSQVAAEGDHQLLKDVRHNLDEQAKELDNEVRTLKTGSRVLKLKQERLDLLEQSVQLQSSSMSEDSPPELHSKTASTLQRLVESIGMIERELGSLVSHIREGSVARGASKENVRPAEYANVTPRLRQRWGRYMSESEPQKPAPNSFEKTLFSWAQQRDAARELLERHASWLRSFKREVSGVAKDASAGRTVSDTPMVVQLGDGREMAITFQRSKHAWQ